MIDLAGKHRPHSPVDVADGNIQLHCLTLLKAWKDFLNEFMIERLIQAVILLLHAVGSKSLRNRRFLKQGSEVDALGLPVMDSLLGIKALHMPHHLVDGSEPQFGHDCP